VRTRVLESFNDKKISWQLVYQLATWIQLAEAAHPAKHALGRLHYLQAVETFSKQDGGIEVSIFSPVGGTYLVKQTGQLQISLRDPSVRFDWSEARRLVFGIDALAENAKDWWRDKGTDDRGKKRWFARLWRLVVRAFSSSSASEERRPHSVRAFSLATWMLGAIDMENRNHDALAKGGARPEPSKEFQGQMASLREELTAAQRQFRQAGQRNAQSRYALGMLVGAASLGLVSMVVLLTFWWQGVEAFYAIAMPAGGIGAMVSVLQRMSTGKMALDTDAGRDMIEIFGAVRPYIGAIFGLALMALLLGGLVPAVTVPPGADLAFFAGIGFLAGFNERWAQDMLKGSVDQLGSQGAKKLDEATVAIAP
jgi:hypothetical protein